MDVGAFWLCWGSLSDLMWVDKNTDMKGGGGAACVTQLLHLEAGEGPSLETLRDLVTADQAEFGLLPAGKENFNI